MPKVGIHSIEIALPLGKMTIDEMASSLRVPSAALLEEVGVVEKPALEKGQEIFSYASRVAKNVVERAGISPKEIGVLVFASCGVSNRQMWSPAAWTQNQIGASGSHAFDIQNGCNSGNVGMQIAANFLDQQTDRDYALLVVADQLSAIVDYTNPVQKSLFSFADGASAVLLSKKNYTYEIGSFSAVTKGEYSDSMRLVRGSDKLWVKEDEEEDRLLLDDYRTQYPLRIRKVLEKEGLEPSDIDHIFMNQADHKLLSRLAASLGISPDKIHASYRDHGHIGGSDIFLGLKTRENEGRIKKGDRILLSSSALGFSWGASLIRRV